MKDLIKELKHHIPFTAFATLASVLVVLFIRYYLELEVKEGAFHFFHFLHVFASAMVTGALFYKYKKKIISALLVGVTGAVIIGSISDVIFPYLGWLSLGMHVHFHLPIIEETIIVLLLAIAGSALGIFIKMTELPHIAHVSLSVFASLFYILAFSTAFSLGYFVIAFFVVFFAVIIPCCLSDIVFPFLFLKRR